MGVPDDTPQQTTTDPVPTRKAADPALERWLAAHGIPAWCPHCGRPSSLVDPDHARDGDSRTAYAGSKLVCLRCKRTVSRRWISAVGPTGES